MSDDLRLLLVDDENIILDILQEHLSAKGFDCVAASTPKAALGMLRQREASLMLTDIMMPEMNGIDLAQAARSLWPDLSVIVMTGKSDATSAIAAFSTVATELGLR